MNKFLITVKHRQRRWHEKRKCKKEEL
uniref:Uncharacterized protein n=1 Tax=Anopheles christyi TaxID=43041 RepID=A0A182KJ30_9DIPT